MDFGRLAHIDDVDFSLPPDDAMNDKLWKDLGDGSRETLHVYVGCTSWGRKEWVGKLYPKGAKEKDFLGYYVKQFNCIELNALFYNLQPREVISRWASLADPGFRFCPKYSNTISHIRQLQQVERDTDLFLDHMLSFGNNLGYSFLQLSDRFAPNRAVLLQQYLRHLPRDFGTCVELRHENWFSDRSSAHYPSAKKVAGSSAIDETWHAFRELGIGTVITDTAGRRDCLHMRLTAPAAFIRFVANDLHVTDYLRIDAWADRIRDWIDKGLREIYFFVHNHDERNALDLADYAIRQFNKKCGTSLRPPKLLNEERGDVLTLF